MVLKAILIEDSNKRLTDLGEVLAIARSVGQTIFKTKENIRVWPRTFYIEDLGHIVLVEFSDRALRSAGVSGGKKKKE